MRVLLAGESWSVTQTHTEGVDQVTTSRYHEAGKPLIHALESHGHEVTYLASHVAHSEFPDTIHLLRHHDVVILSDIGSNTLLLHPRTQLLSERTPNRLALVRDFVRSGGGLLMCGGYMSFAGIDGRARYAMTPLASALPVTIAHHDDRMERPEGVHPMVVAPDHPVVTGIDGDWPHFLGYNQVTAKAEATVVAVCDDDPLIVAGQYGDGRAVAFTSDSVPHWAPPAVQAWDHYSRLFDNIVTWLGSADTRDDGRGES